MIFNSNGSVIAGSGSGVGLNFRVVGGTTEPSNPKENTIWVNTNTKIHAWDFCATEPHRRSNNKNLILYPFYHTTLTENGITFTDNGDGTVSIKGTATAEARFRWAHTTVESGLIRLEPGTYTASGCPSGGAKGVYKFEVYDSVNEVNVANDFGSGATFTLTKTTYVRGSFIVYSGVTIDGTFKPQIEKCSVATSFVKGDATGQVWFATGLTSIVEFNALKKKWDFTLFNWLLSVERKRVGKMFCKGVPKWNMDRQHRLFV